MISLGSAMHKWCIKHDARGDDPRPYPGELGQFPIKLGCRKSTNLYRRNPLSYRSNTGSVTLTGGIVEEETGLGLEIVDCQDIMSAAGNSSVATSLELLAPGDEVRQKPRQSTYCLAPLDFCLCV